MKDQKLNNLINGCLENNRAAQSALFSHFGNFVMNIANRYAKDDYQSKSIFLSAFEKAFRKIDQYQIDQGNFQGWLAKITVNEALGHLRKGKKYVFVEDDTFEEKEINPSVISDLESEYILEIIRELQHPFGIIFNMVMDGYKHKEIAKQLGITESTSRSYFFRAREILKKKIIVTQKQSEKWEKIV